MSLTTSAKSTYEPIPPGTYNAVCIGMVDCGTMTGPFGSQQKVWLQWEVDKINTGQDRYTIGKLYTNSISSKAKLREHLEAWRGKQFTPDELQQFDLRNVLGAPCLLTIGNTAKNDRMYDSVDNVARLMANMEPLEPQRDLIAFDMDKPDTAVLEKLPDWLEQQIRKAPEFTTAPAEDVKAPVDEVETGLKDIPF